MNRVTLGDVAVERREKFKGDKSCYPTVGLEHLTPEKITLTAWDESGENTFTKFFHKDDILFGRRRAYLKKAVLAPFDGICSGDITVITAKPNYILPEFLSFVIQNDSFFDFAVGKSAGSLSPRVKWEYLKKYEFNLPSLEEQISISKILWSVNDTIEAYKKLTALTDELVKAKFIEMFENKNYPYRTLDELSEKWLKGQPFKKDDINNNGETPCIHYGELFTKYGAIIDDVISRTNNIPIRISMKGDILFPASDVTPSGLARCSALMVDNVVLGGDIIILRLKQENCPEFISKAICCQKKQLLSRVTGALVRHISAKALKSVIIPVPSLNVQKQFADFARQSDKAKLELERAITVAKAMMKRIIAEKLG